MAGGIDPFREIIKRQNPLGATLSAGTVTAVNLTTRRCTVNVEGVSLPNIQYAGIPPNVNDRIWMVRHGSTHVALPPGLDVIGVGNASGNPLRLHSAGSDHGFMAFFVRDATPTTRTGYFGYGSAATTQLTIANEATNGDIRLSASGTGQIIVPVGSAALPSLTYPADTTTGIFRPAAGLVGFASGGVEAFRAGTGGLRHNATGGPLMTAAAGAVGAPAFSFTGDTDTGMYRAGADVLSFATGGVEQLRVSSVGARTTDTTGGARLAPAAGTASLPAYTFSGDLDTGMYRIGVDHMGFATAGLQRWAVDSAGTLYTGSASTAVATATSRIAFSNSHYGVMYRNNIALFIGRSNASDGGVIEFRRNGTSVGTISVTAGATAYNTSSDERLKRNIIAADTSAAMNRVKALRPREFDWQDSGEHVDVGLVAQEVAEVYPEAVTPPEPYEDDDGTVHPGSWMIDYGRLTPLLLAGLQSLSDRVDTLEVRLAALEAVS